MRWQIIKDTETTDNWMYGYKFLNRPHLILLLPYVNLAGFGQNAKVDTTYIMKLKYIIRGSVILSSNVSCHIYGLLFGVVCDRY